MKMYLLMLEVVRWKSLFKDKFVNFTVCIAVNCVWGFTASFFPYYAIMETLNVSMMVAIVYSNQYMSALVLF
jgi:hypothetical protein